MLFVYIFTFLNWNLHPHSLSVSMFDRAGIGREGMKRGRASRMRFANRLLVILFELLALGLDVPLIGLLVVSESNLAEVADDVLDLRVLHATRLAAEVVEPSPVGEHVVHDGDDDGDGHGVQPDTDNGDDIGPSIAAEVAEVAGDGLLEATRQPAEDTEDGGEGVNTEDGANELPGWEGLEATGDEDQPVLSERDLEEEDLLDGAVALDNTSVREEECATDGPGTESEETTKDDGDDPDLGQLPLDRALLVVSVIVGDSDGSQIGEQGDEDNELGADGLLEDDHRGDEIDLEMQAKSDTVLDVGLHALENLARDLDGGDDGGQTGSEEDNVSGGLGSLSGTLDGDTAVRLLERWSIVDTVTSHGRKMATLLKHLDNLVLVLGENLGETVGLLAKIMHGATGETTVDKSVGIVNLGA